MLVIKKEEWGNSNYFLLMNSQVSSCIQDQRLHSYLDGGLIILAILLNILVILGRRGGRWRRGLLLPWMIFYGFTIISCFVKIKYSFTSFDTGLFLAYWDGLSWDAICVSNSLDPCVDCLDWDDGETKNHYLKTKPIGVSKTLDLNHIRSKPQMQHGNWIWRMWYKLIIEC